MPGKKIEISDDCLMKQLKLKSYRAFEVVFNRYYAGLYRFALAYLMNRELAEDVVQEVFCSLWTSSLSIPESTHLKSYLYASVKHACLDYFKHLQVIDINQDKLTEALIFSGTIEYEDNEDLLEKVKACLDKLPEQQRRVLELKVFRDMSYREIAEQIPGSNIPKIKRKISRITTKLKNNQRFGQLYPYIIAQEKALENNYMPVLDDDGDDDDDMYNDFDTMDEKSGWKYIGSREELAQKRKTRKK